MDWLQHLATAVNDYMQTGFYKVNAVQGLLIAIGAAYVMPAWSRLFVIAIGATLFHVVLDVVIPVLGRHAAFRLPPLVDIEYWRYVLALYVGFLIIIPVFFLVKIFLVRGHGAPGH